MGQTWEDLLFAHWQLDPEVLRRVVPPEIPVDHVRRAAVGVAPLVVHALRLRGTIPPPLLSSSRRSTSGPTRRSAGGRGSGSSASTPAAAWRSRRPAGRAGLPYFHARMAALRRDGAVGYESRRAAAELRVRYGPAGGACQARPRVARVLLTERYCLYALDSRRRVLRAEIHHRPWPLQPADAAWAANTLTRPLGVELGDAEPLLRFAARQDVVIWPPAVVA